MERLFNFVYQNRAFFTFLILEIFCAWLLIQNNKYQSTQFFNTSNRLAANIIGVSQSVKDYFSLRVINADLARENASLRTQLDRLSQIPTQARTDSIGDSLSIQRYEYVSAKVINNSIYRFKNFITIDKGRQDGIEAGMAAISAKGAVGKVKSASDHFAVLISLLNTDEQVSSVIKRTGQMGTAQWDGTDPRLIDLLYIPRHETPQVGDSIVTSGYNAVFPPNILVGVVKEKSLREEALFWDIKVELAQDFGKLAFVEVVKSTLKQEVDSLQNLTIEVIK